MAKSAGMTIFTRCGLVSTTAPDSTTSVTHLNATQQRESRHGDAVQAEVQIFLDVRRIENRDAAGLEYVLALVRQGRGFRRVIVAREDEHATVLGGACGVSVLEDVATAIHAGTLPVPDGEHAVVLRVRIQVDLLGAPDRGGGEVFVDARLEFDVMLVEELLRLPERLVESAERRAAIPGNEPAVFSPRRDRGPAAASAGAPAPAYRS